MFFKIFMYRAISVIIVMLLKIPCEASLNTYLSNSVLELLAKLGFLEIRDTKLSVLEKLLCDL